MPAGKTTRVIIRGRSPNPITIQIPNFKLKSSDEDTGDVCSCKDCSDKPKEGV